PNQLEITITLERRPDTSGAGNVYIGLTGEDSEEGGAKITGVVAEGPAEKAGLKSDDIVQAIGDKPVTSYNQFLEEIRSRNPGDKTKLKVQREGQSQEVEVTIGERPPGQFGGGFRGQGQGKGGA